MPDQNDKPKPAPARRPTPRFDARFSSLGSLRLLLALALVAALYFTKSLMLPMVVALLFSLLLSPLVAWFRRYYVPRAVSALFLVTALMLPFTWLGMELAAPAQKWAEFLPKLSVQFAQNVDTINNAIKGEKISETQSSSAQTDSSFLGIFQKQQTPESINELQGDDKNVVADRITQGGMDVVISLVSATPGIIAQLLTGLILIVFLLVCGPGLFSAFITGFHHVSDKEQAIALIANIQKELSHYIVTVSIINSCLAIVTALALTLLGMEDALLWGVMVGLLNFAPYVGTLIGLVVLVLAGLAEYGMVWFALMPSLAYLAINFVESQFITPAVLSRQMQLNPLVLIIWLLIWGWLWGVGGVLLAVPLLVCIKIIGGQLGIMSPWLRVIEAHE